MTDLRIRADSVDVEEIMRQIRARIREKRGIDYTEQQIRELATVKLERFLDPKGVRSDLLDEFKRRRPERPQPSYQPPVLSKYEFEDSTLFESNRPIIEWVRKLLRPILKLFFNPNPLIQALHIQSKLNAINLEREIRREIEREEEQIERDIRRQDIEALYYEVLHNLVVEMTRLSIEVKNLKMRVESVSSRLDFGERRARALENVVQYKPGAAEEGEPAAPTATGESGLPAEGPGQRSRRRRRRRGRRGSRSALTAPGPEPGSAAPESATETSSPETSPVAPSPGDTPEALPRRSGGPADAEAVPPAPEVPSGPQPRGDPGSRDQ